MAQQPRQDRQEDQGAPGPADGSDRSAEDRTAAVPRRQHDPGDAVPEGVAPEAPAPLTEHDRTVLQRLRDLPDAPKR